MNRIGDALLTFVVCWFLIEIFDMSVDHGALIGFGMVTSLFVGVGILIGMFEARDD